VPQIRVALAQVNATVGDLEGNARLLVEWTRLAAGHGARIVVFPEMMLTGYPVEDLALRASFVDASIAAVAGAARRLAAEDLGGIAVVTGYLGRRAGLRPRVGLPFGAPLDAAALLYAGTVAVTSAKHHLPNYGVFDEYRYFVPGDCLPVFRLQAAAGQPVDVAIAICEDLWQDGGPVAVTRQAGAGLLVVPNASPYERGKDDTRLELCQRRAREAGAALAYVNMVGGQDELVFDGDSIIVDAAGTLLARGPQFEQALIITDLELPAADQAIGPGETPADASDGTVMTIKRLTLAAPDGPGASAPAGRAAGGPRVTSPAAGGPAVHDPEGADGRDKLAPAHRSRRGLRGPGHRHGGLRPEERLPLRDHRPVRRHRLGADRYHRRRRDRAGPGARRADAQPVLLRPLRQRRRRPGEAAGPACQDGADRRDGRRLRVGA
jgi:NAD+ synthase (glutamine-hydrolysing)